MFQFPGDRVAARRAPKPGAIEVIIDGGASTLSTGLHGYLVAPYACTLVSNQLLADESGSIVVDIWKCTYAQFDAGSTHPVSGDSITASDQPTLSSATKSQDNLLTGWNTQINAGDILAFNINSVTAVKRLVILLNYVRW